MHHPHRIAAALAAAILSTTAAGALLVATALPIDEPASRPCSNAQATTASQPPSSPRTAKDGEEVKYYVVPVKPEGEQEFLFDIAQRFLGDGNRYTGDLRAEQGPHAARRRTP